MASASAAPPPAAPAWKSLKGMRRVQAEFRHLSADIAAQRFGFIQELSLPDENNMLVWQLKLSKFDDDVAGGRQLNEDLARLQRQYGQGHLLMQIEFPKDYPHKPFFVRLVSPRCVMYSGHVTAGGSICLEALTCSGTPGSWQPDFSVEGLLNLIVINMIDCPVAYVQTTTGPGGRSGPLRVDFNSGNPTRGYSSDEARAAFHRTLANHQRLGWGSEGAAGAAGGAPAGPAAAAAAAAAGGGGAGAGSRRAARVAAATAAAQLAQQQQMLQQQLQQLQMQQLQQLQMQQMQQLAAMQASHHTRQAPPPLPGFLAGLGSYAPAAAAATAAGGPGGAWPGAQQQPDDDDGDAALARALHAQLNPSGSPLRQRRRRSLIGGGDGGAAAAAAGPGLPGAAAAAGGGAAGRRNAAAAAAAGGAADDMVIDLCDDDDDSGGAGGRGGGRGSAGAAAGGGGDSSDEVAFVASVPAPARRRQPAAAAAGGGPAAAAAAAGDGGPAAAAAAAGGGPPAAAAAGGTVPAAPPLQRRKRPLGATVAVDSDSDGDSVQFVGERRAPVRQRTASPAGGAAARVAAAAAAAAAAATAAAGAATTFLQQQQRQRRRQRDSEDDDGDSTAAQGNPISSPTGRARRTTAVTAAAAAAAAAAAQQGGARRGTSQPLLPPASALVQPQPRRHSHHQRQLQRLQRHQQQQHAAVAAAAAAEVLLPEVAVGVQEQVVLDGAAGAPRVTLDLELPAHWDYSTPMQGNTVRLVPLPLPHLGGVNAGPRDPLEAAAAAKGIVDGTTAMLTQQGLSRADALAALLLEEGGGVEDALLRAVTCMDLGGAAKVWADMQAVRDEEEPLRQAEEAAQARRLADEAESVLSKLEATSHNKITRNKILKIERVQNSKLWRRYALRRNEVAEERGRQDLNERILFHGTGAGTADRIVQEGFDMRLVNHASAYGNGVYFADHSSTAYDYCLRPDNTAAAGGFGGGGLLMGGMPMLAVPPAPVMRGRKWSSASAMARAMQQQQQAQAQAGRQYKMIVARVTLGRQTTGTNGMRRPPDGYDSVNSGNAVMVAGRHAQGSAPYCHVLFDNDQAYPAYIVTLTP